MRIRITRSARRHRIGNAHILAAMADAGEPLVIDNDRGQTLHYVGRDDRGVEVHVIAVPDDRHPTGLAVIHAMPTAFSSTSDHEQDQEREDNTEGDGS